MRRLITALVICAAGPASAGLEFCNETQNEVIVAIGYSDDGAWTSEGWWRIAPGGCKTAVGGDLAKRYYYYRAKSDSHSWGGQNFFFCTASEAFTIVGDKECEARGYERVEFNELDTGQSKAFTMSLTASSAPDTPVPDKPAPDTPVPDTPVPDTPMPGPDARIGGPMDEPGTHGEPYSVQGILSHCEVFDASMACEVHAEGWRYVANSAGPTRQALLEDLLALPENTPISISGDLIYYEDISADVTIRSYQLGGTDRFASYRRAMQGLWWSLDDPKYELSIHGGIFEEMYLGVPTDTSMMQFGNGCPDFPGPDPVVVVKSFNPEDEDRCMFIESTGKVLELAPVAVMNTLRFERAR